MPGAEEKKISRWVIQGFHSQSVGKIAAAAPFLIRSNHSPLSLTIIDRHSYTLTTQPPRSATSSHLNHLLTR
ncbi:hypothetical protein PGT21_009569 [Puccinia graminis f. sp. tritici]|uniref:Uncharacterized protein n=1 Tax=Puccinia graminis f. sp. tritici TaxID=56615 RepID=A0A5B0ND67_PUCGR|nr:hypothetical protein PGT21_009569 [Puccinia graminis f. sp. tritici]